MNAAECEAEFRFRKMDIPVLATVLAEALDIPDRFICEQGTVCDGIEGLCILLR